MKLRYAARLEIFSGKTIVAIKAAVDCHNASKLS